MGSYFSSVKAVDDNTKYVLFETEETKKETNITTDLELKMSEQKDTSSISITRVYAQDNGVRHRQHPTIK